MQDFSPDMSSRTEVLHYERIEDFSMGSIKTLILLLMIAAVIGVIVLIFKPNYRRDYNLVSNRNFYSSLTLR